MVFQAVSKSFSKMFGSRNERVIKAYRKRVELINAQEEMARALTDADLRQKTLEFNERHVDKSEEVADMMPEVMAVAREAMDRFVGIRNTLNPEFREQFDSDKLSPEMQATWKELCDKADALQPQPVLGGAPAPGYLQVEVPNAFYDAVRAIYETSRPPFRARPFDVQLIGGMVLSEGRIAEMRTGEGKTIVGPLACYAAAIEGLQCHVVTVNDYLVQRDRDWVFPFYFGLGLNVGAIHPQHQQHPQAKAQAYMCNVVYGTNSEFGFDYLRDNMKTNPQEQVQKRRDFCIVDEIDSILIDEARTPLIISGPAKSDAPKYELADKIARHLVQKQAEWNAADKKVQAAELKLKGLEGDIRNSRDKAKANELKAELKKLENELPALEAARDQYPQFYEVEPEKKQAHVTHDGVSEAQKLAGVGSFYVGNNIDLPHLIGNAIKAHTVYNNNQHYVVQNGEVVIVDEFTGRLMVGRQWSDGLHQAVETKEKVKVKDETQTLATVTIQNYFKLYERLAGMTGTAVTESTEFGEIYKLDVVCIPTNRPIARIDREDLIFLSEKDKWNAIIDEVKRVHDLGRPVLVGTTSVEKSEMLSDLLRKRHGIKHEVLNAKAEHAEREGHIVEDAGRLGAVMIATNMAGRGTDIKLRPVEREALINHWKQRNLIDKGATPEMSDDELVARSYRHQAIRELGLSPKQVEGESDEGLKLQLFRKWCENDAYIEPKKAEKMSLEDCVATLDELPDYGRHELTVYSNIEQMGGLHIVGTERHESRRIDNQLRGRSGRQGDQGSSRFFLSLEDDLMQMFAGDRTKMILSKLGMKEGDAIEHGMVSRSVERAQRKVEERNYEIRKNLLEYDEVMEYQRRDFYGLRQQILENKEVPEVVFEYVEESIGNACDKYLAKDYVKQQAADWCLQTHDISVDPAKLHFHDLDELTETVRNSARDEMEGIVDVTLGEYVSNDTPPDDWDVKGLTDWARTRFEVSLPAGELKSMNVGQIAQRLKDGAAEQIAGKDLSGLAKFMEPQIPQRDLSNWCEQKFAFELEDFAEFEDVEPMAASEKISGQARDVYAQRELKYDAEFMMEALMGMAQANPGAAVQQLQVYVKSRFQEDWDAEEIAKWNGQEIMERLTALREAWIKPGGKLETQAAEVGTKYANDEEGFKGWVKERFGADLSEAVVDEAKKKGESSDKHWTEKFVLDVGTNMLRAELTRLERFVLLQTLDQSWKDHLYAVDQLKDSIGLRGYAEKDPRIEFKREGANLYGQMQETVRERVTELIFRARLTPQVQAPAPGRAAAGPSAGGAGAPLPHMSGAATPAVPGAPAVAEASPAPTPEPGDTGEGEAGSGEKPGDRAGMTRKQRRAAEARERKAGGGGKRR
ncbi:MAG: preprotein translocase subunit SecA [Planctomycetota bacterium]